MNSTLPAGALITGAAQRIGRAIALDLGRRGCAVAIHHHRSSMEAATLVTEIEASGGRAVALQADLGQEAEAVALMPRVVEALGPIDCLINNASVFHNDTAATATRESWDSHIETNLRAPLVLTQAFAAQIPKGGKGAVINLLDQRVWNLTPYFLSYTVSKGGLWTLTRTLALAMAPRIRVNAIGPGPTLPSVRQSLEQFARQCASTPLGCGTTPEEICDTVRFILGAPSLTGQMIALDGGQHLGWAHPDPDYVPEE